jgi:TP901 family phage tail tape measure protein
MAMTKDELQTIMSVVGATLYQAEMAKAAAATHKLGDAQESASRKGQTLEQRWGALKKAAHPYVVAIMMAVAATAAVAAALKKASDAAREFERNMADLDTQAGFSRAEMAGLEDAILGTDTALTQAELADAIKPFAFAGWAAADAMKAWEVNARAAEAYAMDAAASGDALLKTMVAFDEPVSRAAYVMDILAAAAAGGTMEFGELARYVPRVSSAARGAGASLEEMAASLQAISFYAGSAEEAAGGLNIMYRSLAQNGYNSRIEQEGLLSVLRDIYAQTGGNRAKLQEMLGSAEAVDAIVKLSTGDFAMLSKALNDMAGASGTVADALGKRRDSLDNTLKRLQKSIADVIVMGGKLVNQVVRGWVDAFVQAARAVGQFMREWQERMRAAAGETEITAETIRERAHDIVIVFAEIAKGAILLGRVLVAQASVWMGLAVVVQEVRVGYYQIIEAYRYLRWSLSPTDEHLEQWRKARAVADGARTSLDAAKRSFGKTGDMQADLTKWYGQIDATRDAILAMIAAGDTATAPPGAGGTGGDDGGGTREGSARNPNAWGRKELAETVLSIERAIYQVQMSQLEAYSRVSDKLKTTYQTIQQIIGGRLDQGAQDAISRLGSMGVASNQLIRTASRRGDNEIVLKLNWSGDTPEAARKAAVDWLLPTLQRAAGAGGAVAH